MKRTLLKIAIVCLLAAGFLFAVSCVKDPHNNIETTETDPGALIAGKSGSVFSIVYPARWTDAEYNAAQDLQSALSKSYASVPKLTDDSKAAAEYEILVGNTNRPESASALEGQNDYGWAIRVIGNRIVINAKLGTFLPDAVEYFVRTYVGSKTELGINHISEHVENSEKYGQPYVIAVGDRSAYTVCYPSSGSGYLKSSVSAFAKDVSETQGITFAVKSGKVSSGKAITLSADSKIEGWKIVFEENGDISILGGTEALAVCALNTFQTEFLKKDAEGDILLKDPKPVSNAAADYTRSGWLLAAPAYEGGTLASRLYNAGTGVSRDSREQSYMMCVSGTTAAQFDNYLDKLSVCGYVMDSENTVPSSTGKSNLFSGYRKGSQYLWVYYLVETGEVRVIEDRASTPISEFEYTIDFDNNTATELYSYGMKYAKTGGSGALQIIKQADGSVILIDGGSIEQATPAAVNGLWSFLHEITGKSANETITISCWFITHPHGDHYVLVSSLIETYRDKLNLQRVVFNFPDPTEATAGAKNGEDMGIEDKARNSVSRYFPNAMFLKCHTGQSIRLGSLTMDVMITHEDSVDASTGKSVMPEGNTMTSVVRFTFADGTRYLELGDFTGEESASEKSHYKQRQELFAKMYAASEFVCKITSVAHHGYNSLAQIYPKIKAGYALWSNALFESSSIFGSDNMWKWVRANQIKTQLGNSGVTPQIFYAGQKTTKLECRNGNVTVTQYDPVY